MILSNKIIQTILFYGVTHSLTDNLKRLAVLALSPLFVNRFGCSLQFCHLEYDEEAISDGYMAHSRVFRGEGWWVES